MNLSPSEKFAVNTRLDVDLVRWIDQVAAAQQRSRSQVISRILHAEKARQIAAPLVATPQDGTSEKGGSHGA